MVVDAQDHLRGLFTLSDVDRITHERQEQFKPARQGVSIALWCCRFSLQDVIG